MDRETAIEWFIAEQDLDDDESDALRGEIETEYDEDDDYDAPEVWYDRAHGSD